MDHGYGVFLFGHLNKPTPTVCEFRALQTCQVFFFIATLAASAGQMIECRFSEGTSIALDLLLKMEVPPIISCERQCSCEIWVILLLNCGQFTVYFTLWFFGGWPAVGICRQNHHRCSCISFLTYSICHLFHSLFFTFCSVVTNGEISPPVCSGSLAIEVIVLTAPLALAFLCQTYSCCCCRKYNHPSLCQRWFSQPANQPTNQLPISQPPTSVLFSAKKCRRWHTSTPIEEARRMLNNEKKKKINIYFFQRKVPHVNRSRRLPKRLRHRLESLKCWSEETEGEERRRDEIAGWLSEVFGHWCLRICNLAAFWHDSVFFLWLFVILLFLNAMELRKLLRQAVLGFLD